MVEASAPPESSDDEIVVVVEEFKEITTNEKSLAGFVEKCIEDLQLKANELQPLLNKPVKELTPEEVAKKDVLIIEVNNLMNALEIVKTMAINPSSIDPVKMNAYIHKNMALASKDEIKTVCLVITAKATTSMVAFKLPEDRLDAVNVELARVVARQGLLSTSPGC